MKNIEKATRIEIEMKYDNTAVLLKKYSNKGKWIKTDAIINPLELTDENHGCTPEQVKKILHMLYQTDKCPDTERVEFETETEFNNYLVKLDSHIDKYTEYIENYTQQQGAEESNERIRKMITFVKEYEFVPARITKYDFRDFYITNAFAMIDGLERRNERKIAMYAIDWIKRMGFQKVSDFPNTKPEDVIRYVKSVDSSTLDFDYEMCFELRKGQDGKYDLKFFYDFYNFDGKHMKDVPSIYTPVFMRKGAKMIDSKSRIYTYR